MSKNTGLLFLLLSGLWTGCTESNKTQTIEVVVNEVTTNVSKITPAIIYRSTDAGRTWMPYASGIPQEATVSSFIAVGNTTYATTDTHGIYVIKEGEASWHRIDTDLPENVDINAIALLNDVLFIGTYKNGILVSRNNGINWEQSSFSMSHTPIRCLISYSNLVFAGTDDGIYKSTDSGTTWTHVYKEVQTNGFTIFNNKIYAALMNGALMTSDEGATWHYIYKPLTLHDISNDGENVYAMTLGGGLLKSKNDGLTWENINIGFGEIKWYTFDVKNADNQLFAAQWHGIYSMAMNGTHWQIIKNGLPDSTAFSTLEVTPSGLIAGIGLRKK